MATDKKQIIRDTWKRFCNALQILAQSEQGPKAMTYAATLVVMMLGINGLNVVNSFVGREFMTAIEHRQLSGFRHQALLYALVFAASTVVAVLYRFTEERLGILWREQLTWRLTEAYLTQRAYYRLDSATGVANPDQRIAEDIRAFTTTTLSFTLLIINGSLTAISFSGVLWSISPGLFCVAVIYAVCGSLITVWLGKRMIRLNYDQLDMEANFRAELIHVRENSESIALAHREGRFKARLKMRLSALAGNFRRIILINRNLGFFTTGYNYFIQIIPALIIAPMFIKGDVEFGVITQSTMAFGTLLGAFSLIVTQFQSISAFTAVTARLHLLSDALSKAHHVKHCWITHEEQAGRVVFENVTLKSADKSTLLIENLNLEILRGSKWLVTAVEDAQKIALFRVTAGLWDCGEGKMVRPGLEDILFLPERPYLPPGTLRDVLLRTGMESVTKDSEITVVLRELGLEETVERAGGLGADKDWDDVFAIGEQHLLSVARLFLARPAFVLLDRPGSSLPTAQIAAILDMLTAQDIGVIVLAKNGESCLQYDFHLELKAGGKWEVHHESPAGGSVNPGDLRC
jgi:putative ATP-binding cassette transporter